MKSSYVFIVLLVIAVVLYLIWRAKHKEEENKFYVFLTIFVVFFFVGGCTCFNLGSTVTVVNGTTSDSVTRDGYFLFYTAKPEYGETQTMFIVPGKHIIVNRTDVTLLFSQVVYGNRSRKYAPIDVPPHSIVKVPDEPRFFFENPPKYVKTKSSGATHGLIQVK